MNRRSGRNTPAVQAQRRAARQAMGNNFRDLVTPARFAAARRGAPAGGIFEVAAGGGAGAGGS